METRRKNSNIRESRTNWDKENLAQHLFKKILMKILDNYLIDKIKAFVAIF